MFKLNKENTKRMLSLHGWAGMVLGLLLYVVVLTGSIVVFGHELGEWSVSGVEHAPLTKDIEDDLRRFAAQVPPEHLDDVSVSMTSDGYVEAFFHTHAPKENGQIEDTGTRFKFDPATGAVIKKETGFVSDFSRDPASALEQFLLELHVNLHVPGKLGLYLTGVLGLVLLVAAVSGFLLHRHIFKEMFLSPRIGKNFALTARDKHNLAGTWGLPFSFILAFTGAFFSFALSLGLPVIAMTAFGGDQQKAVEVIVGEPEKVDGSPALMASLERLIVQAEEKENAPVFFASITHWGTIDARVFTFHGIAEGNLYSRSHVFSMVTGDYLGVKPRLGKVASTGNDLVNLMGVLHFGTFAGILSRIIWFSLGLATCYVTITGIRLWLKRREERRSSHVLLRLTEYIVYGLPIACACSAIGFFLGYPYAHTFQYTVWGFLIGCMGSALITAIHFATAKDGADVQWYLCALGVLLYGLPLVRLFTSGVDWRMLFANKHAVVIGMDLAFLIAGLGFVYWAMHAHKQDDTKPRTKEQAKAV